MAPEYTFSKETLPRGLSFPLKRSLLDAALTDAGVLKVHEVYYSRRRRDLVLWAHHCSEGLRNWAGAGLSSIMIYAVPSQDRHTIETALLSEVLPRLMRWLRELE